MSVFLKCLVDTAIEARAEPDTWRPVLASLTAQPAFEHLPEDVAKEILKFLADGKTPTKALSRLWTECFRVLEQGADPPWAPPTPPDHGVIRTDGVWDWNQFLQFNELSLVLGLDTDNGLYVRDRGIVHATPQSVAVQLRRLVEDLDALELRPDAVLAHDRESVPLALALADRFGCSIEPTATPADCVYLLGNLSYAGALERARAALTELKPGRAVVVALLLTENPNALRMVPDVVGLQTGSAALPWGRAAGVGVLLRGPEDEESERPAVADRAAFEESRDNRPPEVIARELKELMDGVDEQDFEEHVLSARPGLRRILGRKTGPVQPFGWRIVGEGEDASDWHTLLPPFPPLFGTPFSSLPERPTIEELRSLDQEEEQLQFMDWVEPTLKHPTDVWLKQDVRGQTYTHYFATVHREGLESAVTFVVEAIPHGDDLALNNYTLLLDPRDADELRFGRLLHRADRASLN
jgi:hypothetical protein